MIVSSWREARSRLLGESDGFERYLRLKSPFAAFIEQELGETLTDDVRDMLASVWRYPVTVARSANSTGKTHAAARLALAFYKLFPAGQVWTAAAPPEDNLRKLLWGEIGAAAAAKSDVFTGDKLTDLHMGRSPRSFVTGVTIPQAGTPAQRKARFSGKHAPHLLFILDEGDAVPDEVYEAIESCMSGGFARLLVLFNPRHQSGPVHRMERDGLANVVELSALRHPNVVEGREVIPGAVDRETTVRRVNEWTRPLMDGETAKAGDFVVPDYLVGAVAESQKGVPYPPLPAGTRRVTDPAFSYMVLGLYPAEGERQLVSRAWTDAAVSRFLAYRALYGDQPPEGIRPVMGLDVADEGKDTSVALYRYGGWVAPIRDTRQGVDADAVATWASKRFKEMACRAGMVDGTGVGAGVAPKMGREGCRDVHKVMVGESPTEKTEQGEFGILRDQLLWAVREHLRTDPGAMLPPDEALLEELHAPHYDTDKPDGKIRVTDTKTMKAQLGRSPDRLMAYAMTFYRGANRTLRDL